MTTFNADSLDFVDGESAEFGTDRDFELQFDGQTTRLELNDLVNNTVAYVQQNRAGDLVDGRYAQTVAEGKILTDAGELYEDPETAANNAGSWMKFGPGTFYSDIQEFGTITILGSGYQTVLRPKFSDYEVMFLQGDNIHVANLRITGFTDSNAVHLDTAASGTIFENVWFEDGDNYCMTGSQPDVIVHNCHFEDVFAGIHVGDPRKTVRNCEFENVYGKAAISPGHDTIFANNILKNCGPNSGSAAVASSDCMYIGNRLIDSTNDGLYVNGVDNIIANNRISDSGNLDIQDQGTGTVLDGNITGPAN